MDTYIKIKIQTLSLKWSTIGVLFLLWFYVGYIFKFSVDNLLLTCICTIFIYTTYKTIWPNTKLYIKKIQESIVYKKLI